MAKLEGFNSRWGVILAALGMAVGAGNIWRFPRLAGQYGGSFILLWVIFMFIWAVPLLMTEFSLGKKQKKGVIGSFAGFAGDKFTWMGFFITLCTLGIAFYYSVITGWSLRYLGFSLENLIDQYDGGPTFGDRITENPELLSTFWQQTAYGSLLTATLVGMAVVLAIVVLYKGISGGLEKVNKVLIPSLFGLLVLVAAFSLSLDGGVEGLNYLFTIDSRWFIEPVVYIEALSQAAWSTGAGWGLILTMSAYSNEKTKVGLNSMISVFGDATASLIASMAILPGVFALAASSSEAEAYLQAGNQTLIFNTIPQLFAQLPGGGWLSVFFFTTFFMAAFSSLLPMLELFISNLTDIRISRKKSAIVAGIGCFLLGLPSSWSLDIFNNQDWVWGVGLIVSGLFFIFAVVKYGPEKFYNNYIYQRSDFQVSAKYFKLCMFANLPLGIFLVYWWLSQGYSEYPWFNAAGQWNFFDSYSNASVISQWVIVLVAGLILNKWLYKKIFKS